MNLGFKSGFKGEIPRLRKPMGKIKQVVNTRAFQLLSNKDKVRALRIRKSLGEPSMVGISSALKTDNVVMNQISELILKDF